MSILMEHAPGELVYADGHFQRDRLPAPEKKKTLKRTKARSPGKKNRQLG